MPLSADGEGAAVLAIINSAPFISLQSSAVASCHLRHFLRVDADHLFPQYRRQAAEKFQQATLEGKTKANAVV